MTEYKQAREELEQFVRAVAPDHIAHRYAPDTWEKLQAWHATNKGNVNPEPISVSDEFSAATIYSNAGGNFAFRAWHDSLHLYLHYDFTLESELSVARVHYETAQRAGLSPEACALLYFDTAGQSLYEDLRGEFPDDQYDFVLSCMDNVDGYRCTLRFLQQRAIFTAEQGAY